MNNNIFFQKLAIARLRKPTKDVILSIKRREAIRKYVLQNISNSSSKANK